MTRFRAVLATTAAAFLVWGAAGAATAASADDVLLPHPGPDGLVWVEEHWGDGGVASGGAWEGLPTVLTVACEGGGTVTVTMESQQDQVAAFTADCPAGEPGRGSVTMPAGVVRSGSFTIGVDASSDSVRWALTVTQPE
ncbi:hypothetical protein ACWGI1_04070 [Streptomyces sp. NPDC054835]|uniref:hypothetical protein n=1 Tax=Streptomyces sp. NBC_01268 TaxID=2903806 RepID=UPI002E2F05DB|nr:hypothetical protein [Streptomyces sp. NBC_01268]